MKRCVKCLKYKDETLFYMLKGDRRSKCKKCTNAEHKEYVETNRDKIRGHDKVRHIKHHQRRIKAMKKYHASHADAISVRKSEYGRKYLKLLNGKSSLKRKRLKQATPKCLSIDDKAKIIEIYEYCPDGYHVDHIVPIKGKLVCGLHVPWNLQCLSEKENLRKYNKY